MPILYTSQPPFTRFCTRHDQWPWRVRNQVKNTFVRLGLPYTLWLKADLRSKCEFLNTSHLLIEGYILEIVHGKTEYSLTIYITTIFFSHIGACTCALGWATKSTFLKFNLQWISLGCFLLIYIKGYRNIFQNQDFLIFVNTAIFLLYNGKYKGKCAVIEILLSFLAGSSNQFDSFTEFAAFSIDTHIDWLENYIAHMVK